MLHKVLQEPGSYKGIIILEPIKLFSLLTKNFSVFLLLSQVILLLIIFSIFNKHLSLTVKKRKTEKKIQDRLLVSLKNCKSANTKSSSRSYKTFFFDNEEFFRFSLVSLCICNIEKKIIHSKMTYLISKIKKMKKKKFYRISYRFTYYKSEGLVRSIEVQNEQSKP